MGKERKRKAWSKRNKSCKAMQSPVLVWALHPAASIRWHQQRNCSVQEPPCTGLTAWRVPGSIYLCLPDQRPGNFLNHRWSLCMYYSPWQILDLILGTHLNFTRVKTGSSKEMQRLTTYCPITKFFYLLWTFGQCFIILLGPKELLRLEGIFGADLIQPSAQAGPHRRHLPKISPNNFWVFPRMDTPQPPWTTSVSVQSLTQ